MQIFNLAGHHRTTWNCPVWVRPPDLTGRRADTDTFFCFTSFTTPGTIYRYDLASGKVDLLRQPKVDFDPDDYETRQVFYTSKDGTRVPMFICAKRD